MQSFPFLRSSSARITALSTLDVTAVVLAAAARAAPPAPPSKTRLSPHPRRLAGAVPWQVPGLGSARDPDEARFPCGLAVESQYRRRAAPADARLASTRASCLCYGIPSPQDTLLLLLLLLLLYYCTVICNVAPPSRSPLNNARQIFFRRNYSD